MGLTTLSNIYTGGQSDDHMLLPINLLRFTFCDNVKHAF